MENFTTVNIKREPGKIENTTTASELSSTTQVDANTLAVAEKLMEHLRIIRDFNARIEAIDYLTDSADKLAGNLTFTSKNQGIITAIGKLGGTGNSVDFDLFKKAVDIVLSGYDQMAFISLMGVKNE